MVIKLKGRLRDAGRLGTQKKGKTYGTAFERMGTVWSQKKKVIFTVL
jgi:hypothetical protein